MAVNGTGVIHRTEANESEDAKQVMENFKKRSWKTWPNQAAFEGLEEHRGPIKLEVKGRIPSWVAGTLYRTGPGPSAVSETVKGTHSVSHWFDGFAQCHKFEITASETDKETAVVSYSSRRQSDDYIAHVKATGWRAGISFAQRADPCVGLFAKLMSYFVPHDAYNNNNVVIVANHPGLQAQRPEAPLSEERTGVRSIHLASDNKFFKEIHPDTLEPIGLADQSSLHPLLNGPLSASHAQRDPETGDWFNFNVTMGRHTTYRVFRVGGATGETSILASISEPDLAPAYIHSFFMTENYVILCVPSSHIAWNGLKIVWKLNVMEAMKPFDKEKRCKWFVIDRRHGGGVVAKFSTPAAFFFHSINAFETSFVEKGLQRRFINLDHAMYDNMDIMFSLYYDILLDRNDAAARYFEQGCTKKLHSRHVRYRFLMPLSKQTATEAASATAEEVLSIASPHSGELSTIHPRRTGKHYRYVYGACTRGLSTFFDSIVKTDLETSQSIIWSGATAQTPGEPIFVPRPNGTDEDDGAILCVVLDGSSQKSYLLCLDAKSMEEVGRAEIGFPISMGFHGFHAPVLQSA